MNRSLTLALAPLWLAAAAHAANTAPTVVIQSAAMRGASGLMDVVFRVNDPDDATVKTRALAFIDGQRSFAKLVKPTTFAEGTGSKIGDAIATNTNHTLTWNVASDWNIDLGQIKFEILAMDSRGLLPLDWVTIPAANGQPELTISKNAPSDQEVLDALFWQYASGDPGLTLENGVLRGSTASGVFDGIHFVDGSVAMTYAAPWAIKSMGLSPSTRSDTTYAVTARAINHNTSRWHATNKPYTGMKLALIGWGLNNYGQSSIPQFPLGTESLISAGVYRSLSTDQSGRLRDWGYDDTVGGSIEIQKPDVLNNLSAVAAGVSNTIALKRDGSILAWGANNYGQSNPPAGSTFTAVSSGFIHCLALRNDGSIAAWGSSLDRRIDVPAGIHGARAISAGWDHSLAIKSDGTVIAWGGNSAKQCNVPSDLDNVIAISASAITSTALKSDGTVVSWGYYSDSVEIKAIHSKAIAAGLIHKISLNSDGTVTAWGNNDYGQTNVPDGLSGVIAISAGGYHNLALQIEAP